MPRWSEVANWWISAGRAEFRPTGIDCSITHSPCNRVSSYNIPLGVRLRSEGKGLNHGHEIALFFLIELISRTLIGDEENLRRRMGCIQNDPGSSSSLQVSINSLHVPGFACKRCCWIYLVILSITHLLLKSIYMLL